MPTERTLSTLLCTNICLETGRQTGFGFLTVRFRHEFDLNNCNYRTDSSRRRY